MKLRWFAFLVVLLAGCSSKQDYKNPPWNAEVPVKRAMQWMPISEKAGAAWGVSPQLITAIIAIESGGNPNAVSKSNAIGLMQLKASTSGRDVYRRMGWSGEPSTSELIDWLKLLLNEDMPVEVLQDSNPNSAIPPLHGALLKNEQDVMMFERLAFMARRNPS